MIQWVREKINHIIDIIIILILCILSILFGLRYFNFHAYPFEDAAILMRYSQNLAEGHGVVWNIDEAPVDGATDFLFMIVLSFMIKLGISAGTSVFILGFASHLATITLIYLCVLKLHDSSRIMAILASLSIVIGPGLGYVAAYFGTTFFAFFVALTWYFAYLLLKNNTALVAFLFSLTALTMGLIRPEGVIIASLMLLSVIWGLGVRRSLPQILIFGAVFVILGGAYFFWRWDYFGHPLPNPFYIKGRGQLFFSSLRSSVLTLWAWTVPFNLTIFLSVLDRKRVRLAIFSAITLGGFVSMWLLLSNEMNYLHRFQYAGLPIFAMSWPTWLPSRTIRFLSQTIAQFSSRARFGLALLGIIALGQVFFLTLGTKVNWRHLDGRYDVAMSLKNYAQENYTMATTEAGLLPFYSGWKAIDTWGLNDPWIAHNGGITKEYLDNYKPELIMFHAHFSPVSLALWPDRVGQSRWDRMVWQLYQYAEQNDYILAAVFGDSLFDTHYYYVRKNFDHSDEIVSFLRNCKYIWYQDGRPALDFLAVSKQ